MTDVRGSGNPGRPQLAASTRLDVLDLYGIPYDLVASDGALNRLSSAGGPALVWPSLTTEPMQTLIDGIRVFAPVAPEHEIDELLDGGSAWETCAVVRRPDGGRVSSVRRAADGSVFLPFDPNRAVRALLTEEYLRVLSSRSGRLVRGLVRRAYYRIRPVVPRRVQIALRRRFAEFQQRASFPMWPIETALGDLHEWLLAIVQDVAGQPLPQIAWWPAGNQWAVMITHDVERAGGYAMVEDLARIDSDAGLRSAWYFVPERDYAVEDAMVARLLERGFEIGVHGLRHDGRDLLPGVFERRLAPIRSYGERWYASGFRAPSTQRSWDLIAQLGFDHDSSYLDTARFEPQGGGTCSWLPFFVGDVVELPITLPMDHTLFELLGEPDGSLWNEKAAFLRDRGGLAVLLTHPDYLADAGARAAYIAFLDRVASDTTAWHALPREVSEWWRRRSASRLQFDDGAWRVDGPAAAEATVVYHDRPSPLSATHRGVRSAALGADHATPG